MEYKYFSAAHKGHLFYKLLTRRDIFQLTRYEYEGVSESIDPDDKNFTFIGLAELLFLKRSQF